MNGAQAGGLCYFTSDGKMNKTPTSTSLLLLICVAAATVIGTAAAARAGEQTFPVTLRLVKADRPGETVDVGTFHPEQLPQNSKEPVAAVLWPRNIRLDGEPAFEIYYKGKLVGRQATVRRSLAPGTHTIWPGNHSFSLSDDGTVATDDPELIVEGAAVGIKCYPVTIAAYNVNSPESSMVIDLRLLATDMLSIGVIEHKEVTDPETKEKKTVDEYVDLVPFYHSFKPFTIYLPATDAEAGEAYNVRPGGISLHVRPEGIELAAPEDEAQGEAPQGDVSPDVRMAAHKLYVPFRTYEVAGRTLPDRSCQAVIPSGGSFGVGAGVAEPLPAGCFAQGIIGHTEQVSLTYSAEPHRFMAGSKEKPKDHAIEIEGSLAEYPEKAFAYENTSPHTEEPRIIVVERKPEPLKLGAATPVRVRWLEPKTGGQQSPAPATEPEAGGPDAAGDVSRRPYFFFSKYQVNVLPDWQWRQGTAASAGGNVWQVQPPDDLAPGVYTLRTAICDDGKPTPRTPWSADMIVGVIDSKAGGALGFFTQKARDAFVRGESFYIGLGIKTARPNEVRQADASSAAIPPGTPVQIDVTDPFGHTWPLAREITETEIEQAGSMHFWLPGSLTARLAEGRYEIVAHLADLTPARFQFNLVDPQKATNFVTMLNGKYSRIDGQGWAAKLEKSRSGEWTSERLCEELGRLGVNRIVWTRMGGPIGRYYRSEPERRLEDLYRNTPTLPPWQSVYFPTCRERMLNSSVRHGIEFALDIFPYEDDGQPSHLPHLIGSQRYTALQMQAMRHSPANLGFCAFNERYSSPGSNWPQGMLEVHMQALQQRFLDRYGYTTGEALKAKNRFIKRPPDQRNVEDLEKYRPLGEWSDYQYDDFVRRTRDAANSVAEGFSNTTYFRSFASINGFLTGTGYPSTMYENLDWACTVQYKDGYGFGSAVLYTPHLAKVLRTRDDLQVVPSVALWGVGLQGPQIYTKHLFGGIGQNIDGLAYFMFKHEFQNEAGNVRGDRDLIQATFRDLLVPYGDWLLALEPGYRQIGIYYSRQAQMLGSDKHISPSEQAEAIWTACMRAGYPADYIFDEALLAGGGKPYKVIFVPGFTIEGEAPQEIKAELQRLARTGHTLIVGKRSILHKEIDGIVRLNDTGFDKLSLYIHSKFWFPNHWDADWILLEKLTNDLTALLKRELPKYVEPAVESDLMISPNWLAKGELSVLAVPNFEYPDFTYEHIEQFHKPYISRISFSPRGAVCYDVLENALVAAPISDGRQSVDADVRHYGGKLYAFLPAPIGRVRLRAGAADAGSGNAIACTIGIEYEDGRPVRAAIPIQIDFIRPDGSVARTFYRSTMSGGQDADETTADASSAVSYTPGLNAPGGTWVVRVRELISGTAAEAAVRVGEPSLPGPLRSDDTTIWAADVPAIRKLLCSPAVSADAPGAIEAEPRKQILIPLERSQQWARPEAERLAQGLRDAGRRASVVDADDVIIPTGNNVLDAYHSWRKEKYPPPMHVALRGPDGAEIECPVIAIGKRWESRLIEALLEYSVPADVPSRHHPGPGKALIQHVWKGFSVQENLVCVSVSDEAGLRAAVDWLLGHAGGPNKADGPPVGAGFKPALTTYTADTPGSRRYKPPILIPEAVAGAGLKPAPTGQTAPPHDAEGGQSEGTPLPVQKRSFRELYPREDEIRQIAFHPKTGRIAVATKGWGDNIFCLDSNGKRLWSRYLPEHNVHRVQFSSDGSRIIAGVGMPAEIYVLDSEGGILFRFDASEYPQHRFRNVDEQNGFPFFLNPANDDIYAWGKTGVMAVGLDGSKRFFLDRWELMQEVEGEVVQEGNIGIEFGRRINDFSVSPDGRFLAIVEEVKEASTKVIRGGGPVVLPISRGEVTIFSSQDGRQLASWADRRLRVFDEVSSRIRWLPGSSAVVLERDVNASTITVAGEASDGAPADSGLPKLRLRTERRLVSCIADTGRIAWERNEFPVVQWAATHDGSRLYALTMYGTLHALDPATGADLWSHEIGFKGILSILPDENGVPGGVLFGGLNGKVMRIAHNGTLPWSTMLRNMHDVAGDYDSFVHIARRGINDISTSLYPAMVDREGDLEDVVRFGMNIAGNGSFEGEDAWQLPAEGAGFSTETPHSGKRALAIGGALVVQPIDSPVIPNATYLLEFHYRPSDYDQPLTAGVLLGGTPAAAAEADTLTAMPFVAEPGRWHFGRLAVKAHSDTASLTVGFEALDGRVLVDDVSLRAVRFPSQNFLFNRKVHALKPRFVDDLSSTQRGVPRSIETELIRENHITWTVPADMIGSRGEPLESMALLQNGRLDDVGKMWHTQPDPVGMNIGLTRPRYVSHIVVYFSHQYPGDQWPRFQVRVNDVSIKNYRIVASVRGNSRHFCVVRIDPVLTDLIYITPVGGITQWDATITEVEVYGPLTGAGGADSAAADAEAWLMPMQTPARVPEVRQIDLTGELASRQWRVYGLNSNISMPLIAQDRIYTGEPDGSVCAWGFDERGNFRQESRGGTGSLTVSGTPALHKGRLLIPSADGSLYCLAASDCSIQWVHKTGGRVVTSPLPDGDDLYVASDDGTLYKLDVESGMPLWSYNTAGKLRASPALAGGIIYIVSWDGFCHAVRTADGKPIWKAPVALYSRSSPAVYDGRIYFGDEEGGAVCLKAADGSVAWRRPVGNRISAAPLVLADPAKPSAHRVVFAADDGTAAMFDAAGNEVWRQTASQLSLGRITQPPVHIRAGNGGPPLQCLMVGSSAIGLIDAATGAKLSTLEVPGANAAIPYRGKLYVFTPSILHVFEQKAQDANK